MAAVGRLFTVTVAVAVSVLLQVPSLTDESVIVSFAVTPDSVTSTVPPAPIVAEVLDSYAQHLTNGVYRVLQEPLAVRRTFFFDPTISE